MLLTQFKVFALFLAFYTPHKKFKAKSYIMKLVDLASVELSYKHTISFEYFLIHGIDKILKWTFIMKYYLASNAAFYSIYSFTTQSLNFLLKCESRFLLWRESNWKREEKILQKEMESVAM